MSQLVTDPIDTDTTLLHYSTDTTTANTSDTTDATDTPADTAATTAAATTLISPRFARHHLNVARVR